MSPAGVKGAQVTEDTRRRDRAAPTRIGMPHDAGRVVTGSLEAFDDGSVVAQDTRLLVGHQAVFGV